MDSPKHFFVSLVLCAALCPTSFAQFNEPFTYPNGPLVPNGGWAAHSAPGLVPVQVNSNHAVLVQGAGGREDVNRGTGTTMGPGQRIFAAFDVIVNGGFAPVYFAHFKDAGVFNFPSRVFVTNHPGGNYTLALSGNSSTPSVTWPIPLSFGVGYRVVTSYDFDSGGVQMWLDPSGPGSSSIGAPGTPGIAVTAYALRQAGGDSMQVVDNLCVSETFTGALGCEVPPRPPCDLCGPGSHWIDAPLCAGGSDALTTGAKIGIDTNFDCVADTSVVLSGPVTVNRSNPIDDSSNYPGTRPVDGHFDVIDTEIIGMSLTGGGITLTAGAGQGQGGVLGPTRGAIAEQPPNPPLADSFFDVFFEVDLGGGNRVYNQSPLVVISVITCIPPFQDYIHPTGCLPLYSSPVPGQGTHVANLVSARHDPFPDGACCYPDGSCQTTQTSTVCLQSGGLYKGDGTQCQGDNNGNNIDDICESVIPPAQDCWHTNCGATEYGFDNSPIPCGFFDPGSEPFDGIVRLGGGDPGGTDTRISRLNSMAFTPFYPGVAQTPIELVSLNLVSCNPITVTYCNGQPDETWNVSVGLSAVPAPSGLMAVTKTHDNGGTFTSDFFVQPLFTFTRISDSAVRVLDTGLEAIPPMFLDSTNPAPWVHNATIPIGPQICGINFVPGVQEAGVPATPGSTCVSTAQCCKPVGHGGPKHLHVTGHICTPCPCGACCDPASSGACTELSGADPAAACASLGGIFKGIGSSCTSADGDAIPDSYETGNCCPSSNCATGSVCSSPTHPSSADTDADGLADGVDPSPCNRCLPLGAPGRPAICDQFDLTLPGDGDCDNDGACDLCEIQAGTSHDCNGNGVPDECEPDCNNNGVPDDYDIGCGASLDSNGNDIPDECELFCGGCPSDISGDGERDSRDIEGFTRCLIAGGPPYAEGCACANTNGDSALTTADIPGFVSDILAGGACACPVGSGIPSPVEDALVEGVQARIEKLRNESLETSLLMLGSVSDFHDPGFLSESLQPPEFDEVRLVLSNRRVAKVLQDLTAMTREEQRAVLQRHLDRLQAIHAPMLQAEITQLDRLQPADRFLTIQISDNADGTPTIRGVTLAWESLIVIAGMLGQYELLENALPPAQQAADRVQQYAQASPTVDLKTVSLGRPIVVANALLLTSAQESVQSTHQDAKAYYARVSVTLAGSIRQIEILPYDAKVWETDVLHAVFARPVDRSRILFSASLLEIQDAAQTSAVIDAFSDSSVEIPPTSLGVTRVDNPEVIANGGPIYFRRAGTDMQTNGFSANVWKPANTGWDGHNTGAGNKYEHVHITNNYPIRPGTTNVTAAEAKAYWDNRYAGFSASDGTVDVAKNCHGYSTGVATWVQPAGMTKIIADDYTLAAPQCPKPDQVDWFTPTDHSERIILACFDWCATRPECVFVGKRMLKNRDSPIYTFVYFCPGGGTYMTLYKKN